MNFFVALGKRHAPTFCSDGVMVPGGMQVIYILGYWVDSKY
jgi:hypothetical protein